MNRRGFLGALLAAPMAAPAIAKAAVEEMALARGGFVRGTVGCSSVSSLAVSIDTSEIRAMTDNIVQETRRAIEMRDALPAMQEQFRPLGPGFAELDFTLTGAPSLAPAAAERVGSWMQLASGRKFYPLDPRPEEIHIEDIAAALSKLCRYGGHCKRFYSVAEHSVLMAHAAPDGYHLDALLHDASEAYLADVIRPIKSSLTNYHAIEATLERAIGKRFGTRQTMPDAVKHLDNAILADERAQNMEPMPGIPDAEWGARLPALGVTLQFWSPEKARFEFLAAFRRYGGHWC